MYHEITVSFCTRNKASVEQIKLFESTNHLHLEIEKEGNN